MAVVNSSLEFEKIYLTTRKKENRIYSDEEVAQLPTIHPGHLHAREWEIRKRSAKRLIHYLNKKDNPLTILEVGCGNGWLSANLSQIPRVRVTGIDINSLELSQAIRVFSSINNLEFLPGGIEHISSTFDVIVFAASIQYFPSLEIIIRTAMQKLNEHGEIHILDTKFYAQIQVKATADRSRSYYNMLNAPEMTGFYFHHNLNDLSAFQMQMLYDPSALKNKLTGRRDPFPWIIIRS